ncbi:MAG: hypothetical protein ABIJ22_00480 [Patescibacteria group bacterium]
MKQSESQDQTQFALEGPLYEQPVAKQQPLASELTDKKSLDKNKWKKIVFFSLGFFLVLIILSILWVWSRPDSPSNGNVLIKDEPIDKIISGPLEQRVYELSQELELADPNHEKLPFPPVDMRISFD